MTQEYHKYTTEDHKVWNLLYTNQINIISEIASKSYLKGIQKCQFEANKVPKFEVVNGNLREATGWSIYVVPGLIDNKPFFEFLSKKQFPATTWLRTEEQLDYLEEPDMFHDVFGHIPLLSDKYFCQYLEGLSRISLKYIEDKMAVEYIARLYWFTVEFGLIQEDNQLKIYGAGILSSSEESVYSISDEAKHIPFDLDEILETPYIKDKLQEQYFVIESYKELFDSLDDLENILIDKIQKQRSIAA